ncbi:MAG: immunoglobulin domain-containing protein, partial [Odoribacter sp.]
VEMEEKGCSKTDTCFVFLKDPRSFVADGSDKANEDGFYASGTSFYIKKVVSTELVCEGATSVFTIEVVGNDFYRYAWKKKGSLATLSNENVYRIETTHLDNAGDYYCEVTDVSNNKTQVSATVPLEVIRLPKTKILAASHRICEGESLEMRADSTLLTAGRSYTYLWTGTGVSNSRQKGITVVPSASGAYVLTISDANCFMKDTLEVEVVKGALKLKKVYSIKEGEDISIRAEVLAGMKVNWRVDGILYREVNPLVLNGLKKSVDYTVETSGVCSEQQTGHLFVRSNAGYIGGDEDGFTMPNGLPQIIDQSPEIVGCGKDTASLWVEVLKKEEVKPDGYIWQKYNEVAQDFVNFTPGLPEGHVTGLKTEKIHFSVITAEDEGRFRCRIMGGQGLVDSREINLVKGDVPRIDGKMNDVHQCERTPILFMVSASVKNGKDPNYRWYYSATPNNFRQLLPEQDLNKTFYQINQSAKSDEGYYEVEAYNLCGRVYDTAYLEIWQKPNVAKQNADTSVCLDGSVQLWMEAGGGGHYGYSLIQVETDHNGHYVKDKRVVYSGLEPWYNLPVAGTIDRGYFVWKVWNDCDTTRGTKLFYLDVHDPPIVHYTSVDTTLCIGTSTLVLDAHQNVESSLPTTRYYWTKNGEKISQITAIHTIHSFTHSDTGVYKCYVYNACQAQLMKEFRVHKKEVPLVTLQVSAATSYCEGEAVQLNVKYSSDAGEVQPEWMFNGNLMSDAAPHIVGTHTDTLTMDSLTAAQIGTYSIKLTNGCGYNLSNEVKLMVDMPARFLASGRLEGKDQYLCLGDQTAFVVTASGKESIQYTWTKNHVVIPGERTARLTLNNVNAASAALYECYIQNICNIESESTGASLSILTPGVFTLLGGGKYCGYEDGRNVTLSGFEKTAVYHLFRYAANGSSVLVKTISGASVAEGGTLSFGSMPYGTYYVKATAGNAGKVCESVMKGEIEIIRDITPLQYDFVVSDPICTGGTNGSLTLKGSENDKNIVYHLQRQALADEWVYYGNEIPGNGGALKWGNLVSGVYRVMATSKISGCMMQIGATDTLIERPYPQVFALTALNGDTTDCQGMVADVVLQLSGAEKNCSYTLFKDDVATDRTLVGTSIVWDQVVGTSIGAKYTVLAKTSYGCTQEMGKVTVVEKTAPRPLWLSGDGYFCSGDSGKQKIMIEGNTESGVRYDIYNQKTLQKLTDTLLYGTGKAIVFGLPKLPCAYRVEGVDTLDGCVSAMERTIEIKEDSLKIMPIADQYIHIGTSTQLHADIRQAVGAYSVLWQPADKFALNGNTVAHPTTVALQHAQRFVVQASDANCTVEAFAEVRFLKGEEEIYTEINLSDCLTVQDTLRLCEGEKVTLCSWTSGGTPPYTCTWREPGKSKQSIGTGNRLTDYQMTVSGYIELEVRSDVGQEVKDSIWIEFEKNPRNDLALTHSGLNCARLGETVDFVLKTAEKDVKYTLEYSKDGKRYAETKTTVIGSGIDLPFYLPYADDTVGYYRFKAEKVYKSHTCHTEFNAVELRLRPQRFEINSVGPTEYCADRHRDTIRLAQSENGVTYRLVNTATKKTIQVAEGAGSSILYENYFGSGRYRVVAQLGVCQDTMTGVVNINALPRPLIGKLGWQGVYCLNSGGINPTVRVEKTIRGVVYTLYRDSVNFREQMGQGSGDGQNFLDLGELNKPGNYWVSSLGVAPNGCTDTVRGMSVVNTPQPVKLVESKGMYCYGEGALSDTLKIYAIDPLVVYELEDLNRKVVGVFGNQQKDTLYCPVSLAGGKYYIWPKMSSCRSVLGMYEVVEHKRMTDKELMLPLTECEGYPLNMGVKLSEPGVLYELYENVNGVENKLAEGMGNGRDLIIKTYDRPGIYSITAVDPLAGCSHRLPGEYQIGGAPTKFDILASAVEYCAGDAGVVLGISGTQANVNYQLQQWEAAAAAFVNVSSSAVIFGTGVAVEQVFSGKYKAGKYRIVSESCHQVVMNGEVNISEIPKPTDILVNMKGNACVDSTISLALTPTEVGVKYVLYHNNLYTSSDTLTGNGGNQSWNVPLAKAGVYSVSAIRKECIYPLTRKAEIGVVTKLVDLSGWEPLCANLTKTLSLLNAELTSEYKLWGSQKDTLFTGVINGQHIDFSGVLPGDIYYVKARNQMCEIKSKAYEFKAKELPVVKKENFVIKDCSGTGKGDILLKGLRKEYAYRLVGQNLDVLLMQREKDTLFVDKQAGEYVLTVTNTQTQCELEPIRKTVRRALPSDSVLMPLVYCAGGEGVNIPLSGSSYNVQYSMLSIAEAALETFKAPVKVFTRKYTNGQYVFKKENLGLNGGCISLDTITVEELPIPSV